MNDSLWIFGVIVVIILGTMAFAFWPWKDPKQKWKDDFNDWLN